MKSSPTSSYSLFEQKNSNTLLSTRNNTGLDVSFNVIGIVILVINGLTIIPLFFKRMSEFEIARNNISKGLLTVPATSYFWSVGFISLILLGSAIRLLILGRVQKHLKYLSALLFFMTAFFLICLTNTKVLSQNLSSIVSQSPVQLLYFGLTLISLFFVYIGISFYKSPFPFKSEEIIILSKDTSTLVRKILVYPIPLIIYTGGKIGFASPWIEEKYEYPLSDIISVHKYTSESVDEFTYFAMLRFAKTDTYFPTLESRTIKDNDQHINILCKFLAVPRGEDLNKKNIGSSIPLINFDIDYFSNRQKLRDQRSKILFTREQKMAVSAAMMLEENQRRISANPDDPEANLMLGIAFMGTNLFDTAIEKLQKSKMLYERLGQQRQSVKVSDYLDRLQLYVKAKIKSE